MFCTSCATHNPSTLLRCTSCGARLRPAPRHAAWRPSRPLAIWIKRALLFIPLAALLVSGGMVARQHRTDRASSAAAYRLAEAAVASGDYTVAIAAFADAGDYRDAVQRRVDLIDATEPVRARYLAGADALAIGDYDTAIAALGEVTSALPEFEDAAELLADARELQTTALHHQLRDAEVHRDWLAVERLLATLLAADPENAELLARAAEHAQTRSPIVFALHGALYTVGPLLADLQLITNAVEVLWPGWSPDRTRIAFFSPIDPSISDYALYVVVADGGNLRQVARRALVDKSPVWSPDSRRIAFLSSAEFAVEGLAGTSSIHVVDLATGTEIDVTGGAFHEVASPSWSPEGERIAFVSRKIYNRGAALGRRVQGTLFIVDLRDGSFTDVATRELPYAAAVAWSPAAEKLLVLTSELGSAFYETMITTIRLIDLTSGEIDEVTERSQTVSEPVWSPDGAHFAFLEGNDLLQIRSLDGATRWIELPRTVSPNLSWSPDSGQILAPSITPDQASVIVPLDSGGAPRDLQLEFDFSSAGAGPPQWSAPYRPHVVGIASVEGTALDTME